MEITNSCYSICTVFGLKKGNSAGKQKDKKNLLLFRVFLTLWKMWKKIYLSLVLQAGGLPSLGTMEELAWCTTPVENYILGTTIIEFRKFP
jgi:hypothetical protein